VVAGALGLSKQAVYKLKKEKEVKMKTDKFDPVVMASIRDLVKQYPQYGYRKIYAILRFRMGYKVYRNKVYAMMRSQKILLPPSTRNETLFKGVKTAMNLDAERPNQLWGIDMTYIWCGNDAWGYLHAVIDHYDKTLLGYHFSLSCRAIGAVLAIGEAASRRTVTELELRSDNGCHYGAKIFRQEIMRLGIRHTRTMVNTPKGNAVIERFFRSLKQECVWLNKFDNFNQAKEAIDKWITEYNEERPHQALAYATPAAFFKEKSVREIA
jgi:putative transposase